jgi:hypothetical protein
LDDRVACDIIPQFRGGMMVIGTFEAENSSPVFEFECMLDSGDFHREWVRCSMLANYVAEYTAYQFARREWAENLISTVANDFLEAVVRLSPEKNGMTLRCVQYAESLLLEASHRLRPEMAGAYRAFLTDISTRDIDAIYFRLLTGTERLQPAFNQLGLLMLVHDFGARLAASIDEPGGVITTRVFIPTKELSA